MGVPQVGTSDMPQVEAGTSDECQFRQQLTEKTILSASNSSEFKTASNSELQHLIELNQNPHTTDSTTTWLRRFNKWALQKQLKIGDITDIPKAELDGILQKFYAELVKQNGQEYEPESLKVMIASLNRHIKGECGFSILIDKDFELSRKVLNGKAIQLQQSGKGKRPKKADALTSEEEDLLWDTVLGKMNPISLNYTIFFLISQHFGTRGRQEHHQMRIEDFKVSYGTDGKVHVIEWMEGPTKTRQGGLNKKPRMVTQKLFRTGGKKCPVGAYELLVSKRPSELKHHGPLYLTPLRKDRSWDSTEVWFIKVPLGINLIDTFARRMVAAAGLDSTKNHFTNHSIRKTTVKKLKKAGVNASEIMAITGHKNQQSLTDYDELDNDDHIRLGKILSYDKYEENTHVQYSMTRNPLVQYSTGKLPPISRVNKLLRKEDAISLTLTVNNLDI